jgi:hypothetical protein
VREVVLVSGAVGAIAAGATIAEVKIRLSDLFNCST